MVDSGSQTAPEDSAMLAAKNKRIEQEKRLMEVRPTR